MLHVPVGSNTFGVTYSPQSESRPAAAQGTSVTPVVGSKGNWAQLTASTGNYDSFGILINFNTNTGSAASRNTMVDIGFGAAASETVMISNLIAGGVASYTVAQGAWYYFPMLIPAGTRISARAQSTVVTAFNCFIQCLQAPMNPAQIRKGMFVQTLGAGTIPVGTTVTAGTTAEGAWVSLGSPTIKCWWWQIGVQVVSSDTTWNAATIHMDLACGDATNKQIIIQDLPITTTTAEALQNPPLSAGVEWPVDAGTNLYVRAQTSGTADSLRVAAYGLGG